MEKGLLIIMSGPSGVGKGTIRARLMEKYKDLNLFYSISMTTRKPRPGEENGREYYFVNREEFMKQVEEGNLLEWAEFVGNCYGTPIDKVNEKRKEGKNVLLEIEVNGATQVLNKLKDDDKVVSIFILPPSLEELEKRIRGRLTESEDVIEKRLAKCRGEINKKDHYEYNVVNDSLEKCVDDIRNIILSK